MSGTIEWFFLAGMISGVVCFIFGLISFYYSVRLGLWLRKNHYDKYQKITNTPPFDFKPLSYLLNIDEQQDPEKIQKWKKKLRLTFKVCISSVIVFVCSYLVVVLSSISSETTLA